MGAQRQTSFQKETKPPGPCCSSFQMARGSAVRGILVRAFCVHMFTCIGHPGTFIFFVQTNRNSASGPGSQTGGRNEPYPMPKHTCMRCTVHPHTLPPHSSLTFNAHTRTHAIFGSD